MALLVSRTSLAPAAKRILESAADLLKTSGYRGLTLRAIEDASGENKGLVQYYFNGKPGLLAALADWLAHDISWPLRVVTAKMPSGDERLNRSLYVTPRSLLEDAHYFKLFYILFPHLLEKPETRAHLADLFAGYRELMADDLRIGDQNASEVEDDLAALSIAVTDGLAVQKLVDPAVDVERLLHRWKTLVERSLLEDVRQERLDSDNDELLNRRVPNGESSA